MGKQILNFILAMGAICSLTSCGSDQQPSFLQAWKIGIEGNRFHVNAAFSPQYTASINSQIPVGDYGTITLGPDLQNRFSVDFSLFWTSFLNNNLEVAAGLPTGNHFPDFVTVPMRGTELHKSEGSWRLIGYWGVSDDGQQSLVGTAIELGAIGHNFPAITFTQTFALNGKAFAAFMIYGPKLDSSGQVVVPGGLFLVADPHVEVSGQPLEISSSVSGRDANLYQDKESQQKLLMKILDELEDAGVIQRK